MVHWLTEELVKRGHDVTLYASGDSTTSAKLESCCEMNLIDLMAESRAYNYSGYAAAHLTDCLSRSGDYDIIHCHLGAGLIPYTTLSHAPVVHTIHEWLGSSDDQWLLHKYSQVPIAVISHSQISTVQKGKRDNISVIHHGCDLNTYTPGASTQNYLAFIGRMGPQKNPAEAIRIAKALNMPIRLAGVPQDKSETLYFNEAIKPQIDGQNVIYMGSLSHRPKVEFLRHAAAVLFPIQWDEPFGLVMIESMACGTPVVAIKRGSVPEVIDPGITGYYCDHLDELPELVQQALLLDRKKIRRQAELRFSISRMTNDYLEFYSRIMAASTTKLDSLAPTPP
jgi:glycosyltransferase involved in cell wall biosynthesis